MTPARRLMNLDQRCLQLSNEAREDASSRLRSIRGHVDGIIRMLDRKEIYCVDILRQVKAVDSAVQKVSQIVLRSHLHDHVVTAAARGDADTIIDELMEILRYR